MDEQGLDRTLMFPTLASLLEERMKDDPELMHVAIHSFNEWLHETWHFNHQDRIFTTPIITLPIVERAIEELEWVLARGARAIARPPGAGAGLQGPALVRAARVRPVLGARRRGRHPRRAALVRQRLRAVSRTSGSAATRSSCRSSPTRSACCRSWRPIEDAVASLICHGALARFPALKIAVVENGAQLGRAAAEER